jgi:glycogen synthase
MMRRRHTCTCAGEMVVCRHGRGNLWICFATLLLSNDYCSIFYRACLEFLKQSGQQPHVLQLHDWHAAAAALLYWECYHSDGLWKPRVMLTIHNLENTGEVRQVRPSQGGLIVLILSLSLLDPSTEKESNRKYHTYIHTYITWTLPLSFNSQLQSWIHLSPPILFVKEEFLASGVHGEVFASPDKALDERTIGHNPERINLMKGGIVYSNAVTTVSPSYAKDILNAGAAGWLRTLFTKPEVTAKFRGILNGIDCDEWNPETDALLAANFNADYPRGKELCKEFLQKGLGLNVDPKKPLIVVVSRLVPQKGINLIKSAVYRTVQLGGQFVLLGSGHSDGIFRGMANSDFKDHKDCRLMLMYSERLAHQIYAAADIVVVPSMFEPCGLTQLIALRYGAVPLVRSTGGLADTVFDVDNHGPGVSPNGYSFQGADEGSLFSALDRALARYREKPEEWHRLSVKNMQQDVSWGMSAKFYVDAYRAMSD